MSNPELRSPPLIRGAPRIARELLRALRRRRTWPHLFIHRRRLTKQPAALIVPLLCGPVKGKLTRPPELTIVLIHDYPFEPVLERSLRYVGIHDYVVLRPPHHGPWRNSAKITALVDYLGSGACRTEYLLFADSDDAVLRDAPQRALHRLEETGGDLLLSNTGFPGGYECMPDVRAWADALAPRGWHKAPYINSGVYVGRTRFVAEVFEAARAFVTEEDLTRQEYRRFRLDGTLRERSPHFPRGIGSDQVVLRFLHPRFHPQMQIDYTERLALR